MNELETRLKEHYQVFPEAMGVVLLLVQDEQVQWPIRIQLGETLEFFPEVSCNEQADARLGLTTQVLDRILQDPENFEPRQDFFTRNIVTSGDLRLMHHFAQLLKRPSAYARHILNHVHAYPHTPDAILESQQLDWFELLQYVKKSQPIVFRQIFDWPSLFWNLDEFDSKVGMLPLRFNALQGGVETLADMTQKMRLGIGQRVYTSGVLLPQDAAEHFPFPQEWASVTTPSQIWMGHSRAGRLVTKLHCDIYTSLLTQVWGKKKARLYPPQHHQYLYPMQAFSGYQPCLVDPLNPNLSRYPDFDKALCLEVEIEAGDMLVIPSGWFHCLEADGLTFSLSKGLPLEVAYQHVDAH